MIGSCFGTLAPSSSPNFASLTNLGGCPEEWEAMIVGEAYEESDTVSSQDLVFSCKRWPYSTHCGQQGYEPMTNSATPDAWKTAWILTGYSMMGQFRPHPAPTLILPHRWARVLMHGVLEVMLNTKSVTWSAQLCPPSLCTR